jgi:hypothetical protein
MLNFQICKASKQIISFCTIELKKPVSRFVGVEWIRNRIGFFFQFLMVKIDCNKMNEFPTAIVGRYRENQDNNSNEKGIWNTKLAVTSWDIPFYAQNFFLLV